MIAKRAGLVAAPYILLTRCFFGILSVVAIFWGTVELPVFRQESSIVRIAIGIVAGEPFKGDTLARQLSIIDSIDKSAYCRPTLLRSAAIIRLREVETLVRTGERSKLDPQMKQLDNSIRTSLACSPADPFLWFALYSVESTMNGFKSAYLNFMRMSYQLGPNEGWIAQNRNQITLAIFSALPPDLAQAGTSEFVGLVRSQFYSKAGDIIAGPAWPIRDLLLARLGNINEADRRAFAKLLYEKGFDANLVPGIEPPRQRPYQR
jgi:hypothetical protein